MTDEKEWKQRIAELVVIQSRLAEVDREGIWEHRLPRVAATEAQLREVERHLGAPLDPGYRGFLECAGGWPAFFQSVDLFGPEELLGNETFKHATKKLGYIEDEALKQSGVRREELLPIAASSVDLDLHVMTRKPSSRPGSIIWFAGGEVDRFPSFDEYFLAMMDYNRHEIDALRKHTHS
jgi:SMI1/KNR4 family protein SUKH-1